MNITISYTIIIVLLGLVLNKPKQRTLYIILVGLILVLISGLRSIYIGSDDTFIYSVTFKGYLGKSLSEIWNAGDKDPFYYVFSRFVAGLTGNSFQNFLIVVAVIFIAPICYLIYKESDSALGSFIVFLSMGFFFFSMNGIRQSLAMAFVVLAYFPLKNRKLWQFVIMVGIGVLFHKTAAIFLLAYPMARMKLNATTIIIYCIIILLALSRGNEFLEYATQNVGIYDQRFGYYKHMKSGLSMSGFFQLFLLFVFSFVYYKKVISENKDNIILYNMLILALIFQSMAIFIGEMFRIAMYFSMFIIILIPRVVASMPPRHKGSIGIGLYVLLLIYFFFIGSGTIPYRFYFQD